MPTMPVESQIGGLLVVAILLLGGWCVTRISRFYREQTAPHPTGRYESLDGLRGFLVIAVFLHHSVINYYFLQTGKWTLSSSNAYNLCGQTAVVFFFLITSFLFWSKAIAGSDSIKLFTLYRGRFMRIAPMYFFCCAAIILVILIRWGLPPVGSLREFFGNLAFMAPMGLVEWRPIRGVQPMEFNAYVVWTLGYEWKFYFALPFLAFLARPPHRFIVIVLGFAAFYAYRVLAGGWMVGGHASFYFPFILGAAIAELISITGPITLLTNKLCSAAFLICIALLPVFFYVGYSEGAYLLTAAAFVPVVYGNSVFGLLTNRGAKMLGAASYSIYLAHAIIIRCTPVLIRPFVHSADPQLPAWCAMALQGLIVTAVCAVTYRFIEYPFIDWERRIKGRERDERLPATAAPPLPLEVNH
jgi:peptidoglycan/LPS O-acetylase OafA/YrhL